MTETVIRASVLAALLSAAAIAQQAQPTFRTKVTHVQVDVVVTDSRDRPVAGLTAADFEIFDRGRKQTITDFEFNVVPPANRGIDLKATPEPPRDVSSNAPPARTARAFAFVLDDVSIETDYIVHVKRWMTEFLSTLWPDDTVAITYVSRSDLGQDFTHDVGRLIGVVNNLGAVIGTFDLKGKSGPANTRSTLTMLENVVSSVAAARETRRAVIFISEGHPLSPTTPTVLADYFIALMEHARRLGVPFYTFDPRGLMAAGTGIQGALEDQTPEASGAAKGIVSMRKAFLQTLAENTGGRAFVNPSNLSGAIREIITENGSYYLLGYYPNPDVADGRFHNIDVKVTRPGLRVRARAGYMAPRPAVPGAPAPRLIDSLAGGLPGGDLLVYAFIAPLELSKNAAKAVLTLDIQYPEAASAGQPRPDDELKLVWMALDPDARVRASGQNSVRVAVSMADRAPFVVSVNNQLDLPKDVKVLRIAVASAALGKQAVVHLPVSVPTWTAKALEVTPLVVGTTVAPDSIVVGLGGSARLLPFQPTTSRTFTTQQHLQIYARLFRPAQSEVHAELLLRRGATVIRRAPLPLTPFEGNRDVLVCRVTMALADLPAGPYVLEVAAGAGRQTVRRMVPLQVR